MQSAPVDDAPVFVEPESGQTTASETQQDEKDRRIAELEQLLEETKTNRIQKLETEMQLLQAKETEMNSQHQEHMNDLHAALQRKQAEIDKLSDNHATQIQAMQDDHSKKMLKLDQERKQSEKEIESLRKELQLVSTKLREEKGVPETIQKLTEQLQEKDHELRTIVTEVTTLQSSYEKLIADHKDLRHRYEQLTVEVEIKKELTESSDCFSSNDPCNTTVMNTQVCMYLCVYVLQYF